MSRVCLCIVSSPSFLNPSGGSYSVKNINLTLSPHSGPQERDLDKRVQLNNWISWIKGLENINPSLLGCVELKMAISQGDDGHLSSRGVKPCFLRWIS